MKKGCLIAFAVVALLALIGGCIVAFVFYLTGDPVKVTNAFLQQVGEGKIKEAYESASPSLRAQQSFEQFSADVRALNFKSASWPQRNIVSNRAELKGSMQTRQGGSLPLEAVLLKEGGKWRVLSVQLPSAGVKVEPSPSPIAESTKGETNEESREKGSGETRTLLRNTLIEFDKAVQARDFTSFYKSVATLWQEQTTPQDLQKAFQVFIDKKFNISWIEPLEPEFEPPPKVDDRGVLILEGSYPAPSMRLVFRAEYLLEDMVWKCIALKLNAEERTAGVGQPVPPEPELKKLVKDSLLQFNAAVRARNFETFHRHASTMLQKEMTPQSLQKAFQDFIDGKINIGGIRKLDPVFEPVPVVNSVGVLEVTGYYPTEPKVNFELGYVLEGADWKLVAIKVRRE